MGGNKRLMEEDESKRWVATQFAIEQGLLQRCEYHDCVFERDVTNMESAYKAASYAFARGQYQQFKDQREFTDYIKKVVMDHPAEGCPICEKQRGDD